MKMMMRVLVLLVVLLAVLVAGRNVIVKFAVEKGVQAVTGLPLSIQKIDIGLEKTAIGIKELNLYNPQGFADKVMFHAPELFVDYDLQALLKGNIHLKDVRLDFDQFVVVKNQQGQLNLDALKPKAKEEQAAASPKEQTKTTEQKTPSLKIDHLALKVGKVVYKDYSQGGEPVIKEYNVNISEDINDITDPVSLLGLIAQKALMQTALSSFGDFNATMGQVSSQGVDTIKGEVQSITDKIKLPFGN